MAGYYACNEEKTKIEHNRERVSIVDKTTNKMSKGDLVKNILTILLPILVMLVPCTDVFTFKMKLFLASALMAILCFAFGNVSMTVVALILPVFWVITEVSDAATVFSPWTNYVVWFMLGGLILAAMLEKTGLLKRIAYFCLSFFGNSYRTILVGVAVTSVVCTILIGDIVIPMAALCYGLCKALGVEKSKEAAGIMLTGCIAVNMPGYLQFTAPIIQVGLGREVTGPIELLGYFESWFTMWPVLLMIILSVIACILMFKPEQQVNGTAYFKNALHEMGKLSKDEMKAGIILILYLSFIVSRGFGGLISLEWGMIFIPMLALLPVIGVDGAEVVQRIDYTFIIFVATCLSIGTVSVSLGIGDLLVASLAPMLNGTSVYVFLLVVVIICIIANIAMTPMAILAAFTVPFVALGQSMGIDPIAVYQMMNIGIDQLFFPYESAMYLVFFSYGMVKMNDFIKVMTIKTIICVAVVAVVFLPWWSFIGFI